MHFNYNRFHKTLADNFDIEFAPREGSQTLYMAASNFLISKEMFAKEYDCIKNVTSVNVDSFSNINEILYHGGRAVGKSALVLAEFGSLVGKGYGEYLTGVVFRKTTKELKDLINKAKLFFEKSGLFEGAKVLKSPSNCVVFPSGEKLYFSYMYDERDYDKHHGLEYSFVWFEELALWSNSDIVTNMYSTLRLQNSYNEKYKKEIERGEKELLIGRMRFTTNPYGAGKNWVKKEKIDVAEAGEFYLKNGVTCCHIKGHFIENMDESYINSFANILNKEKRLAWTYGDWNAKTGGIFGDLFDSSIFCLSPFEIPTNWRVDINMDWGTSSPYGILWIAEANGESVVLKRDIKGKPEKVFTPPKGSLIVAHELYGVDEKSLNNGKHSGLNESVNEVFAKIQSEEKFLRKQKIYNGVVLAGVADSAISADTNGSRGDDVYNRFKNLGIKFTLSKKGKGSRVAGVESILERMKNTIEKNDKPHIYFFDSCQYLIENLNALERDIKNPDDIDTNGNDHDYDALRYRVAEYKNTYTKSGSISSFG